VAETADPAQLTDYTPTRRGALGLVQPVGATLTHAVVIPQDNPLAHFGVVRLCRIHARFSRARSGCGS